MRERCERDEIERSFFQQPHTVRSRQYRNVEEHRPRCGLINMVHCTKVTYLLPLLCPRTFTLALVRAVIGVGGINSVAGDHFGARELQANFMAVTKTKGILLFLREGTRGCWGPCNLAESCRESCSTRLARLIPPTPAPKQ